MNNNHQYDSRVPLHVLLRRRREELHMLQMQIAERLRVTPECIGMWESGKRRMSIDKLPRLAEILLFEKRELCIAALREFHPAFYAALFGGEPLRATVAAPEVAA
jgi:transcriptional regulator with XRE-family HTH domain